MQSRTFVFATIVALMFVSNDMSARHSRRPSTYAIDAIRPLPGGLGLLPPPPENRENPSTWQKIELGRRLFEDPRLSGDESLSCASCHPREMGYTEAVPFSLGSDGKPMPRHTPTLLNAAYSRSLTWDGKFANIVEVVFAVLANPRNMNMQDDAVLVARVESVPAYRALFREAFGAAPTRLRVAQALEVYVRSLTTGNSAFDRYVAGDKKALNAAQKRGLMLFVGRAGCAMCHRGPNFADDQFHALGVNGDDPGRFGVTGEEADRNGFKTPTLRNVAQTAPYMHDGSLSTLRGVIDFYDAGGGERPKSPLLHKLHLTKLEKSDLVAFLESLTGHVERTASRSRRRSHARHA
jgi:cytochrome c peroxidase